MLIAEEGAGSLNGWPPRESQELIPAQRTCLPQDTDLLSLAPPSQDRVTTLNEIGSPGLGLHFLLTREWQLRGFLCDRDSGVAQLQVGWFQ